MPADFLTGDIDLELSASLCHLPCNLVDSGTDPAEERCHIRILVNIRCCQALLCQLVVFGKQVINRVIQGNLGSNEVAEILPDQFFAVLFPLVGHFLSLQGNKAAQLIRTLEGIDQLILEGCVPVLIDICSVVSCFKNVGLPDHPGVYGGAVGRMICHFCRSITVRDADLAGNTSPAVSVCLDAAELGSIGTAGKDGAADGLHQSVIDAVCAGLQCCCGHADKIGWRCRCDGCFACGLAVQGIKQGINIFSSHCVYGH